MLELRACAMVSQRFRSPVGSGAATLAYEPNFKLASLTPCSARLTTLLAKLNNTYEPHNLHI